MAGSINLSLSQQFDKLNGTLLSGGRLYFYAAGTDSPQDAFKDDGLTLAHPNPIILASDGRIPQLYFADGSIHVRLTDSGGVVQFDEDFVLVIGPSSGGGGGGGSSVDPNAIAQTGQIDWQPIVGLRAGWVRSNGKTIGPNGSPASEHHGPECQALFEYLWNTYGDTYCPVDPPGRPLGMTANTAWNSGSIAIATLDMREIIIGGLSDMGNADRGTFSQVPIEHGDRTTPAGVLGEITHSLIASEMPTHTHDGGTSPESVHHNHGGGDLYDAQSTGFAASGVVTVVGAVNNTGSGVTDNNTIDHTHTFTTNPSGGGISPAHNNTPRIMLGTFYMRL